MPEVVELIRSLPVREAILEGEAIALRSDGRPRPFQTTVRRLGQKRKMWKVFGRRSRSLRFFLIVCIVQEKVPLIAQPYRHRVDTLRRLIPPLSLIPQVVTGDPRQAEHFLRQALDAGHEGVMAKSITAPYTAGQRGFYWLKLKAAITLDLVILASRVGPRASVWVVIQLAPRSPRYREGAVCDTRQDLQGTHGRHADMANPEAAHARRSSGDEWTVYVRPEVVVEVAFSDVQESPALSCGSTLCVSRV